MDNERKAVSRFQDDKDSPGFLLWRATLQWQRVMTATLAPLGLTHSQFVILACAFWLGGHSGPPSQARLADQAGMDVKTTSDVVARLTARHLIKRDPDPQDSRANLISVTPNGADLVRQAFPAVENADETFFATVDSHVLTALLRRLVFRETPDAAS